MYEATALRQVRPDSAAALPKIDENVYDEGILCARYWPLIEAEVRRIGKARNQRDVVAIPNVVTLHADVFEKMNAPKEARGTPAVGIV